MAKKKTKEPGNINKSDIVPISEILPENLIILPSTLKPLFPGIMLPLTYNDSSIIEAVENVYEYENRLLGIVLWKNEDKEDVWNSEYYQVGTVVKIYKINIIENNSIQIIVQGLRRFTRQKVLDDQKVQRWKVNYYSEPEKKTSEELKAYSLAIMSSLKKLLSLNPIFQEQLKLLLSQVTYNNPSLLLDIVSSMLNAEPDKLQEILEAFDLIDRSKKVLLLLKEEIELTTLQADIQKQIEKKLSKQQREFFLREQLKIIKKELGLEKDDKSAELEKIDERLKKIKLSKEAKDTINNEIDKLQMLEPSSPEYNITRSYLNVLTELPWGIYSKDRLDISQVRRILNHDHYGLNDVKDLILQFISTIIKRGSVAGSILCLVGPPGVGKTSVGRSIARAMNRKFFRFSLGGMRDEAEIKGHRRTYIGAMPGKIIQSLKRTETANPVIMLDEIDKLRISFQGDPASALLEVLDPEQNKDFLDHYLDVRFDLSKILFITTANQLDTIPRPLLDRMELIKLSGYILQEKIEIAKRFLIPRQLKQHGLKKSEINFTDKALTMIIDQHAREAGVRNLENKLKKVMRQVTLKLAESTPKKYSISSKNLSEFLGNPVFIPETLYKKPIPGVAMGLAWTSMGGATLYIEASAIISKNNGFKQTGQLGGVMKESSEIAFSYIRSFLSEDKDLKEFFNDHFIHLHVPAGSTPKDGPSAGITMALALYSLASRKSVPADIAMTGELTLTGKVLPIGGLKEKTIAARRVKVHKLIFPKENKQDFDELQDFIKEGLQVHFVDYFQDVLKIVYPD
ncbi:MAG: endopeptidase La [Candidatus Cloacimonetes bacterium]|nr:endopeptidase La [Candidatus Cloacimonadota bacterium]